MSSIELDDFSKEPDMTEIVPQKQNLVEEMTFNPSEPVLPRDHPDYMTQFLFTSTKVPKKYIANFSPSDGRIKKRREGQADDPRFVFDNSKSNLLWEDSGKYQSPEEMAKLINSGQIKQKSSLFGYMGYLLAPTLLYPLLKRKAVKDGTFAVVNKGISKEIRLPGFHTLLNASATWGETHLLDDENNHSLTLGNITIVKVRANYLASAYLVGDKSIGGVLGNDGDTVLFSQGSYVIDESRYAGIKVKEIKADESIITIGAVKVLNIQEGYVGGARERATNVYHTFSHGSPLLLDTKEWTDVCVVKRQTSNFRVGPYMYVTILESEIGCIGKKDGSFLFLTEEATFRFHTSEFQSFEKKEFTSNFDIGVFYIRTVEEDQVGAVQDKNGKWSDLKPGRYILSKKLFNDPIIARLDQPLVDIGICYKLRVQDDTMAGAWNTQTGKFDVFSETGSVLTLPKKIYPRIERIPAVLPKVQRFGCYKVVTISNGMIGIFESQGKIECKAPGTYRIDARTIIREPLPSRPIQLLAQFSFNTRERFEMSTTASIHFVLKHPEKVSNELLSSRIPFSKFQAGIKQYASKLMGNRFREYGLEELQPFGHSEESLEKTKANIQTVMNAVITALQKYSESADFGIEFTEAKLVGELLLDDEDVKKNFAQMEKSKLSVKAAEENGKAQLATATAHAQVELEKARRQKEVTLTKTTAESEAAKIKERAKAEIEVERLKVKTKADYDNRLLKLKIENQERIDRAEAQKKERLLEAEAQAQEEKILADSVAYRIRQEAEANAEKARMENETANNIPDKMLKLKEIEARTESIKFLAEGKRFPDIINMLVENLTPHLKLGGHHGQTTLQDIIPIIDKPHDSFDKKQQDK